VYATCWGETGLEVVFVEGNAELTPARLIGAFDPSQVLSEGYRPDTFLDGPLLTAMRGGGLLYLEELNRVPEETLNVLITVLTEGEIAVPRLGTVHAGKRFRLIAAMNPFDAVGTARVSQAIAETMYCISLRGILGGTLQQQPTAQPAEDQVQHPQHDHSLLAIPRIIAGDAAKPSFGTRQGLRHVLFVDDQAQVDGVELEPVAVVEPVQDQAVGELVEHSGHAADGRATVAQVHVVNVQVANGFAACGAHGSEDLISRSEWLSSYHRCRRRSWIYYAFAPPICFPAGVSTLVLVSSKYMARQS